MDLAFLLDASGSIGPANYKEMKAYIIKLIEYFHVSSAGKKVVLLKKQEIKQKQLYSATIRYCEKYISNLQQNCRNYLKIAQVTSPCSGMDLMSSRASTAGSYRKPTDIHGKNISSSLFQKRIYLSVPIYQFLCIEIPGRLWGNKTKKKSSWGSAINNHSFG